MEERILQYCSENEEGDTAGVDTAASNPAFDFLKEPDEDIYTRADGKPFYEQG
jgi:hypothetical protein